MRDKRGKSCDTHNDAPDYIDLSVYTLDGALDGQKDTQDILYATCKAIAEKHEYEAVIICVSDKSTGALRLDTAYCKSTCENKDIKDGDPSPTLSPSHPVLQACVASGDPVICVTASLDPLIQSLVCKDTKHFMFLPLMCGGRNYGLLGIGAKDSHAFSPEKTQSLTSISVVIASITALRANIKSTKDDFDKLRDASRVLGRIGHEARLPEVKTAIVETAAKTLQTDLVALFTIDPCYGDIACDATAEVTEDLQAAFLDLCEEVIAGRQNDDPVILGELTKRYIPIDDSGKSTLTLDIEDVVLCPIRSESGASGVMVAFYRTGSWVPINATHLIGAIADQAANTMAYTMAIEQLHFMLDDMAGANQELSLQASLDSLTGLPNHRSLQQTLGELCRPSRREKNRIYSLVMVDVDHFKIYNDTHGHLEGDAVLRRTAKIMAAQLRQGDIAARYGGEEFALILRGIGKDAAVAAAERIRRAVAEHGYRKSSITVSMGVAEFPSDGDSPGEIIDKADRALYQAKTTGRNRVVAWGGGSGVNQSTGKWELSDANTTVLFVAPPGTPFIEAGQKYLPSEKYGFHITHTTNEAVEILRMQSFDIMFIDIDSLPGGDVKVLSAISAMHPSMSIVLLADGLPVSDTREALRRGASDILSSQSDLQDLPTLVERNLERRRLERQRLSERSTGIMQQAIEALVAAIDARDPYTSGHSQRVAAISLAIATELDIPSEERCALELAAKLHDIGKLALPDSALSKDASLSGDEWRVMREHPMLGAKIVGVIDELAYVSNIIRHHHERLDGTGYPDGLRGAAIPYLSRIITIADAYEAMTSERAHRCRFTPSEAIDELRRYAGIYYSPEIVNVLEQWLITFGEIVKPAA